VSSPSDPFERANADRVMAEIRSGRSAPHDRPTHETAAAGPRGETVAGRAWEGRSHSPSHVSVQRLTEQQVRDSYALLNTKAQKSRFAFGLYTDSHPEPGDIVSMWGTNDFRPDVVALSLERDGDGNGQILSLWTRETGGMLGITTVRALFFPQIRSITFNTSVPTF
jgi:hypothetical protein